jgi:hypothetical protein
MQGVMRGAPAVLVLACVLAGCSTRDDRATAADKDGTGRAPRQDAEAQSGGASPPAARPTSPTLNAAAKPKRFDARLDGFGPLTLGMDMTAAGQAWPGVFDRLPRMPEGICFHASPAGLAYFSLMFDDGKFVRYDVSSDDLVAPGGGRRGMGEAQLQALYGNSLRAAPHRFAKGGKYLSLDASGVAPSRLVFETDAKGIVSEWRVGLSPHADYTEGCESDSG